MPGHIFISHATKDDPFVKELRIALESLNLPTWVDSRDQAAGTKLEPEIVAAIEQARHFLVVLSPHAINSAWIPKEIRKALEVEKQRPGFRIIPLLLPGIEPTALDLWFDEAPAAVRIAENGLNAALPQILAALGEQLPDDLQPGQNIDGRPVEELVFKLVDPQILTHEGKHRVTATATLVYEPADKTARAVESKRYAFTAPLGPIEADDLRWYLESYYLWPTGVFQQRAAAIEKKLPQWGQDLYNAALRDAAAAEALTAWKNKADGVERRFSIYIDSDPAPNADAASHKAAMEAASSLLGLPWELLHDGKGYLFRGKNAVAVRRRLPNREARAVRPTQLPIRILLLSPRPEDKTTTYIDHRVSAKPLVEAVASLGELVQLTVLTPPTLSALRNELNRAAKANQPYDVVHFDGHGVYDREHGLGALCFEDPHSLDQLAGRAMALINAEELANDLREHRIPLIFLEACQSAKVEDDPTASVAAKLLECGVTSVVAMSHSVLVETAHRFVAAFYRQLASGSRVGEAMLAGQEALAANTWRGKIMGAGDLHMHDWFVPVLFQEEQDPQLINRLPGEAVQRLQQKQALLRLGALPATPAHAFHGRSRQLLTLERLLHTHNYAVVRGNGGAGKTTLAVELARWLVASKRFGRAAFVSLENLHDVRSVLDSVGRQLLPAYSVAEYKNLNEALQPVSRALQDHPTIMVLDNLESILADANGVAPATAVPYAEFFALCQNLLASDNDTRLLFTTRETLPAPFDHKLREIKLGPLDRNDAIAVVSSVMKAEGLQPKATDPGSTPQEIVDLVEAVNCHARALVLLAREVARSGVRSTTENLHRLMAQLEQRRPGDRENSLYASVELSLRRLPEEMRAQIKPLGMFYGGAHWTVFDHMLQTGKDDYETVPRIFKALADVGLAQQMNYGHLRFDPALAPYLLGQMHEAETAQARTRWAEGMRQLLGYLYSELSKNAQLALQLTLLELPNLLALLDWGKENLTPEEVVDLTSSMETLLQNLGQPQALARVVAVREHAAKQLGGWSHARFNAEFSRIERLLESDDVQAAHTGAQQLVQDCLNAGEQSYANADYNIAVAHLLLGRVLKIGGAVETALTPFAEAQKRFQQLADEGNTYAEQMMSATITESAECLLRLGRLDEAANAYNAGIMRSENVNDQRDIATKKFWLGTVRLDQRRYGDALRIYNEAIVAFEILGEKTAVADAWYQIGVVNYKTGQYDRAEQSYRQALAIYVEQKNRQREAGSLSALGSLYDEMGHLEEAVIFYRQAVDINIELQDFVKEGIRRSNLANTLIKLRRYDEARTELLRANECKEPYGHAAEPWKTFVILYNLEQATGNPQAAAAARQQAIAKYLAYRQAGGGEHERSAQICAAVAQAMSAGQTAEMQQALTELAKTVDEEDQLFISKLQAILSGDRNLALAADPNLSYDHVAELQLLLERLGK